METPAFVKQELETQYTDFKKLGRKLKELFPSVKCKVVVSIHLLTLKYHLSVSLTYSIAEGRRRYHYLRPSRAWGGELWRALLGSVGDNLLTTP